MDEGGVQFYLDHIVVLHDSGAMLGEGRVCGNKWRERKGVGEEERREHGWGELKVWEEVRKR